MGNKSMDASKAPQNPMESFCAIGNILKLSWPLWYRKKSEMPVPGTLFHKLGDLEGPSHTESFLGFVF